MACTEKNYWYTPAERTVTFGVRKRRGFTGKRHDRPYYRGQLWLGPTNAVGKPGPTGKLALIEAHDGPSGKFGLMPI